MPVSTTITARASVRRVERHAALRVLWDESQLERVRKCRRVSRVEGGSVGVKLSGGHAGISGVTTCGSVWACPVCSAKVAAARQGEIAGAVTAWQASGGQVVQVTLTMRHRDGQSLRTLWNGLSYAWGKVTSGRRWKADQEAFGVAGWVRVVEVTKGCSGWHVHVHALLFVSPLALVEPADIGAVMFQRWRSALVRKGLAAPIATAGGLDSKLLTGDASGLGDYFTKAVYSAGDRAGLEVARGDLKSGRDCRRCARVHRQPFQILADVLALGLADDLDDWHEWERVSRGKRQLTWSKGIREHLLAGSVERSDEAIAEEDAGGELVALLPAASWAVVKWDIPSLLQAFEAGEGAAYLERRGLDWLPPALS